MSSNNGQPSDTKQINGGGSDTARHYKGTASEQYKSTPDSPLSTPITGTLSNGFVGNIKTTK